MRLQKQQAAVSSHRFIRALQRSVSRRFFLFLFCGMALLVGGFLVLTLGTNQINARNNLDTLAEAYIRIYDETAAFLEEDQTVQSALDKLRHTDSSDFDYAFHRFQNTNTVQTEGILTDAEGEIVYSSFESDALSEYRLNYTRAINYVVDRSHSEDIYNAVYFDGNNFSDYMFTQRITQEGEVRGYLTLFVMGYQWTSYLANLNYEGVIVDARNNVVFRSRIDYADRFGKFYAPERRAATYGGERYWIVSRTLDSYGVTAYSLVYYPENHLWILSTILILILGIVWYSLFVRMGRSMAEYNAVYVNRLIAELRVVENDDPNHRIALDSDNEFDDVAHQINLMLDSIRELHQHNLELVELNYLLEMGQLEAQMNPHFLYNTLEIIRGLLILDPAAADAVLDKLTEILRYSVNPSHTDVHLDEDLYYIHAYLEIQKTRFGERFCCTVDIAEDCMSCMVPKLLLQPLIENSIQHGFQKQMTLHVSIIGHMEGDVLVLEVRDDGPGMAKEDAEKLTESLAWRTNVEQSVGLHNTARLLFLRYGAGSGIQIQSDADAGFAVRIDIDQRDQRG